MYSEDHWIITTLCCAHPTAQEKSNATDMTASADQAQTWTAPKARGAAKSRATRPNLAAENHMVLCGSASSLRKETGGEETGETVVALDLMAFDVIAADSVARLDLLALL
jgi:hypothetical protein